MPSESERLQCPACGGPILRTDQQCMRCGARLDEGKLAGDESEREQAERPPIGADMRRAASEAEARSAVGGAADMKAPGYATGAGGWSASTMSLGGGFLATLSRGWRFMTESVKMVFRDKDLIIPSLLAIFGNLLWIGLGLLTLHLTGQLQPLLQDDHRAAPATWVLMAVLALGSYVIVYVFGGMTCHLVDVHLKGRDAKLGEAFADVMHNLGALLVLAVVTTVVSLVARGIRGRSGRRNLVGQIIGDLMEKGWQVASYLLLPVIILEDVGFGEAFGRARELHDRGVMDVIVGEIGVTVVGGIIGFLFGVVGIALGVGLYLLSPSLISVSIAIALLVIALGAAFTAYVRAAYYTCLYLWAAARETAGEQVAAPAPLQPALA